jgi:NAD(P)-dependent dehydrogenase (short-subunit alcohol dehydrogenase family)
MRVLITGANRGIGLEVVRQLHERGDEVWAACRAASDELKAIKDVNVVEGVDMTLRDTWKVLDEALGDRKLELVVQNAGILVSDRMGRLDPDTILAQFEVNALAPLLLSQKLLPRLERGSKLFVITSRMGSLTDNTSGGMYGYRMSKAAVNAAFVSLSRDLEGKGVVVGMLHPGFVRTDMTGGHGNVEADESAADLIDRFDELSLSQTGVFLHAKGKDLPW